MIMLQIDDLQSKQNYSVLIIEQVGDFGELSSDEDIRQRSDIDLPITPFRVFPTFT